MKINIRNYQPADAKELADLFYNTVRSIDSIDYSTEELSVWAPDPIDYKKWQARLDKTKPFIAEVGNVIAGFAEFEDSGHIDCFYVHKDFQRQGVGNQLMNKIIDVAKKKALTKLFAESSITALPFFNSFSFVNVRPNIVTREKITLKNYIVEKQL